MSDKSQVQGMLVQVAHLYYNENLSQQKIADRLGVSRSLIAQYLQRARETGIVRIQICDPDNTCQNLMNSLKKETGIKSLDVVVENVATSSILRFNSNGAQDAEVR